MAKFKFTVRHNGIILKVRMLPTVADVHREFTEGKRRRDGKIVHAFFEPIKSIRVKQIGTVVFSIKGALHELVPHEVTHAVIHAQGGVLAHDDEDCATAVGQLCARIFKRLRKAGVKA